MKAKPVPELEKQYVITKNGRVFRRLENGEFKEVSQATNQDGYKTVVLYKDSKPHFRYIHELVASTWTDGGKKDYVNHKDGDKSNNNASNLEYADARQNTQHAYDKGLAHGPSGEDNGKSKLTKKQVSSIRKSDKSGTKLASLYDVDPATISLIRNKKRW